MVKQIVKAPVPLVLQNLKRFFPVWLTQDPMEANISKCYYSWSFCNLTFYRLVVREFVFFLICSLSKVTCTWNIVVSGKTRDCNYHDYLENGSPHRGIWESEELYMYYNTYWHVPLTWYYSKSFLALLDYVSTAHEIEIRPSSVSPSVASIISEPIAWISFKFWLLLPLGHTPGLLNKKMYFFRIFFINMRPYMGTKNLQTLRFPQITFESFQTFPEFSSQWSSQKYCFGFFKFWVYDFSHFFVFR